MLSVAFQDTEPNDTLATAQPVVHPGLTAGVVDSMSVPDGSVSATDPADYYSFQAAVPGDLNMSVMYTGGTADATVTFYDNADAVIGTATINAGAPLATQPVAGVNTSDVYKVGIEGSDAQYQLRMVNPDREDAGGNSNNTRGTATNLGTLGSIAQADLQDYTITRPDRDYFQFTVPANTPGPIEIRAIMPAGTGVRTGPNSPTNLGLRVRDNVTGMIIASSNGTQTNIDVATITVPDQPTAITYSVEVYSGSVGQVNEYDLEIERFTGVLEGYKFEDANGNGFFDADEQGIPNWPIYLYDAAGTTMITQTTTTADGSYAIGGVPAGIYRVREDMPAGSSQTLPGATDNFEYVVSINRDNLYMDHLDFGNILNATKRGVKFEDLNGNGVKDTGEPGLPGWQITLLGMDLQGSAVNLTATTAGDGSYSFSVAPGTYTVYETLLSSWTQSFPQPGPGIVSAPNGTLGYQITLASGQLDDNNDFGNFRNATKSGVKFNDLNGNGIKDAGEPGLPGWTINLVGTDGLGNAVNLSTATGINGGYSFSVPPGTYTVSEVLQSGWTQSYPASGSHNITLTSGQIDPDNDFGNFQNGTKTGVKFNDLNGNGARDAGEPGLQGWTINLVGTDGLGNAVNVSQLTDVNGTYSFSVAPGTYTVSEVQQGGWTQSFPATGSYNITLTSGQTDSGNDFGNFQNATKTGVKFNDLNGNGVRDAGEPGLQGWTINLVGTDGLGNAVNVSQATDVNGAYSFSVAPGTYTVSEVQQSGWTQSFPATGSYSITLASGQLDSRNDFGNFQNATKTGVKFNDLNANGVRDAGEPGLQGWTINLIGTDGQGNAVNVSQVTDASGAYSFSVPPGNYTVSEVQQSGWTQTAPASGSYNITLISGQTDSGNDFGNTQGAVKTGVKFNDVNGNGVRDAGEPGLPGWTINLVGTDGLGNAVNVSQVTDASGAYSFSVPPGNYTVSEVQQSGWTQSFPASGSYNITLISGQIDSGNDFGNFQNATKTGVKFNDLNGNGARDAGEPGLQGWTINLVGTDGQGNAVNLSQVTNASGAYSFSVAPGTYTVSEVQQGGWTQSFPASGSYNITLTSGQTDSGNDFGNFQNGTKTGVKFNDLNGNGARDAGEPGLPGWTINLVGTDGQGNAVNVSQVTDVNGAYSFSVPPGTYTVSEVQQGGWTQSFPASGSYNITLTSGQTDSGNDFGNFQNATKTGVKFEDLNGNAAKDAGEPGLQGWTINLVGTDGQGNAVNLSQVTDANGAYSFSVPPGTYTVSEVQQSGWTQSFPASGSYGITLTSGQTDSGNDFGNWTYATKTGVKFEDLNGNGVRDPGEPGLQGWTINLAGTDGMGNAVSMTQVTGSDGSYSFSVAPGTYLVYETLQANWTQTSPQPGTGIVPAPGGTLGYQITLTSHEIDSGNDFGNQVTPAFTGVKFYDVPDQFPGNPNGIRDPGEKGLPGWTIELYQDDGDGIFEPTQPFSGAILMVSGITNANPAVVSSANHGLVTGDRVRITGVQGMTEVNGQIYRITVINPNSFSLGTDEPFAGPVPVSVPVDSTGYGVYTAGGQLEKLGQDKLLETAITDSNGNYRLGQVGLPHRTYHIREIVQSGWRQTSSPIVYTEAYAGTTIPDRDFGNTSCVDLYDVADGTREVVARRVGLLTITMSQGTFSVVRQDAQAFDAYDGAGGVLAGVTSVNSQLVDGVQRVDILVDPNDYLHAGAHPTPVGTVFDVSIVGSGGVGTLSVLNAVNVDVANSLALQITGTECGELIVVGDDKIDGPNSDAKAIYFGTVSGEYNGGVDLQSEGIHYWKPIMDAMFGEPSISRVEIAALGGDDIIRVKDEIRQQSMLNGGDGHDNIRGGSGKGQFFGGNGDDLLVGSFADDVIYGNAGDDWIFGGEGDDRVFGGSGNDYIAGFLGNDSLLKGDEGNDRISGGMGRDRLYGDAGFDIGYRDAEDLFIYQIESVNNVPPDPVEQALLGLLEHYWNDHNMDAKDTLDELINDLVP